MKMTNLEKCGDHWVATFSPNWFKRLMGAKREKVKIFQDGPIHKNGFIELRDEFGEYISIFTDISMEINNNIFHSKKFLL